MTMGDPEGVVVETGDASLAERPSLALEAAALIEDKIITGAFAPGERLVELDLCQRYGISRSPMREALYMLEGGGLVIRRPRYGVRVAPLTLENLDQVYACRVPLEALAARSIAAGPDVDAAGQALAACVEVMQRTFDQREFEACFRANVELTDVMHARCPNPVLSDLLAKVNKPALRYRYWAYTRHSEMAPMAIRLNRAMVNAIRRKDPDRAETVTRELVEYAWRVTRETFIAAAAQQAKDAD